MIIFPKPQISPIVFAFQSRGILGYALDKDGKNLPARFAPWKYLGKRELSDNAMKIKATTVIAAIQADGFYMVGLEPIMRDKVFACTCQAPISAPHSENCATRQSPFVNLEDRD